MEFNDQPYIVRTKKQAAQMLGVSRQTIYKWEKEGAIQFFVVDQDWLAKNFPRWPNFRHGLDRHMHAYVINNVPKEIEVKQRLTRYRGIYISASALPGHSISLQTKYSILEAGIRLKHGILNPILRRYLQKGFSRSYLYRIMGDMPGELKSEKIAGRRYITEQAIREYEFANGLPEHKVLVRIYERDDSQHWEERLPDPSLKKSYTRPKVLYFKPFK